MNTTELLIEGFGRIPDEVHGAVKGLQADDLAWQPSPKANTIGWLVWHLTRVQDDHIADVADGEQAWTADGWFERFDLQLDPADTGYGHSPEQVAALAVQSADLLTGYLAAVHDQTVSFLRTIGETDLDRVVDNNWDPPVTLGVRLISVMDDDIQHAGQAAYIRGLLDAR